MGAQPAYSHYPDRAYERAVERAPRIQVVPGTGPRTAAPALPDFVVFLAKTVAVVLVVLALIGVARVALSSAAVTGSIQAQELSSKIDGARAQGNQLEVTQSSLSNPSRIRIQASALGMVEPEVVTSINLAGDIVTVDEQGALSLSGSAQALLAL